MNWLTNSIFTMILKGYLLLVYWDMVLTDGHDYEQPKVKFWSENSANEENWNMLGMNLRIELVW